MRCITPRKRENTPWWLWNIEWDVIFQSGVFCRCCYCQVLINFTLIYLLLLTWWPSSVCHVNDYDIWIFLRYMKRSIIPERVKENEKALWPGEQHLKWIWERNQLKMPLKFIFLSVQFAKMNSFFFFFKEKSFNLNNKDMEVLSEILWYFNFSLLRNKI